MSKNWNILFTNIIRRTNLALWGNWTLNPDVEAGAVGIIEPNTGSFTKVAHLADLKIETREAPEEWSIKDSSVRRTQSEIEFDGGYNDPTTGTKVDVGLGVNWSFSKASSISSNARLVGRSSINDFGRALMGRFDELLDIAKNVNYTTRDGKGIRQGFGVITHTHNAAGGANIASLNASSEFSIAGSVDGINAMTGGGSVKTGLKGSYKETNETAAFESHLWPASADEVARSDIGLNFQFCSFHEQTIMPTWIMPLDGFTIVFDNANGGTYIGKCRVTYTDSKGAQEKSVTAPGGQVRTIGGIPLDAHDLKIVVDFVAGDTHTFGIPNPLTELLTGNCVIEMGGVWPFGSRAKRRAIEAQSIAALMQDCEAAEISFRES